MVGRTGAFSRTYTTSVDVRLCAVGCIGVSADG